jgi:hypothetical protein
MNGRERASSHQALACLVQVMAGSPPQPSGLHPRTVYGRVPAMAVHGQVVAISHQASKGWFYRSFRDQDHHPASTITAW